MVAPTPIPAFAPVLSPAGKLSFGSGTAVELVKRGMTVMLLTAESGKKLDVHVFCSGLRQVCFSVGWSPGLKAGGMPTTKR